MCQEKEETKQYNKDCTKSNLTYIAYCKDCDDKDDERREMMSIKKRDNKDHIATYTGETSKNIFQRAGQHLRRMEGLNEDSFMLRHKILHHKETKENPRFIFRILKFHHSPIERMIWEAIKIKRSVNNRERITMNNKLEFNRAVLPDIAEEEPSEEEVKEEENIRKEID